MPVENPRTWCPQHGFYDCPVCRGEPVEWVIPVINDRTGEQTGTVTLTEQGDVTVVGHVGWSEPLSFRTVTRTPEPVVTAVAPIVVHEPPDPDLTTRLQSLMPSVYEQMMSVPRWREAARKGREIHERAEKLSQEEGIPYREAIKRLV